MSSRNFFETVSPGKVHVFLTDKAGYDAFKAGKPFDAALIKKDADAVKSLELPLSNAVSEWVLIASNTHRARFGELVSASLKLQQVAPGSTTGPVDPTPTDDETGCNCAVGGAPARVPAPAWPILFALATLVIRRRFR